ncbi:MAG: molybdopterin dinucleotide binding domain-containing protein, partial [Verrucomicrobiota bacterium]|nr:molybdopterin dinucleotide binding domain-containing protein [Verrucomicrobiota bacterium]
NENVNRNKKSLSLDMRTDGDREVFLALAKHADVVLAGSLQEEDEGTVTTGEGRCVRLRPVVSPPAEARVDWHIIADLAQRLGAGKHFAHESAGEIFEELTAASAGGPIDYSGMSYERIENEMGIFWPCPASNHPGTPRLFTDGKFAHPDGRAKFHAYPYRPPAEDVDADYPIFFTSGRVVSQYLSGTQTRRIGALVDQYPEPLCEIHPRLAERLSIAEGDRVRVRTRRGHIEVPAQIVKTIRPDTVFFPYHWPGKKAANQITNRALDPISKIPEFKVCACKVEKVS